MIYVGLQKPMELYRSDSHAKICAEVRWFNISKFEIWWFDTQMSDGFMLKPI